MVKVVHKFQNCEVDEEQLVAIRKFKDLEELRRFVAELECINTEGEDYVGNNMERYGGGSDR